MLCLRIGGKLPEPRDEGENDFLASLDTDMFVLGINDKQVEGHWVFDSDGSQVTWFSWAQYADTAPNDGPAGNCAYVIRELNDHHSGHTKKSWEDKRCGYYSFYDSYDKQLVCERGRSTFLYTW